MTQEKPNPREVYEVRAQWDSEAGVWLAESEDVPGLVAEAESPNLLAQKLKVLIPELLELIGVSTSQGPGQGLLQFHMHYQQPASCRLALMTRRWRGSCSVGFRSRKGARSYLGDSPSTSQRSTIRLTGGECGGYM